MIDETVVKPDSVIRDVVVERAFRRDDSTLFVSMKSPPDVFGAASRIATLVPTAATRHNNDLENRRHPSRHQCESHPIETFPRPPSWTSHSKGWPGVLDGPFTHSFPKRSM